jgi:Lrp/AsnC family transcriptional regulator
MHQIDDMDIRILGQLQRDGTLSVDALSERVNLSRNACWRRVKLSWRSVASSRGASPFSMRKRPAAAFPCSSSFAPPATMPTGSGSSARLVAAFPEIVGVYRTSGDLDYVLRARVSDVKAYDRLYQRLIAKVKLADVSASFVMEEIKETTAIPLSTLASG